MWVKFALKHAEIFKQNTEGNDCKKSENEICVPPPKHDTGVDDICVPVIQLTKADDSQCTGLTKSCTSCIWASLVLVRHTCEHCGPWLEVKRETD